MNKFVLSVVAFFIGTMAVAYTWHMVLFHDVYIEMGAFTRGEPIMILGMTAVIIQGIVIAYVYPFLKGDGHPILEGIRINLILGLMVYTVMGFATAAKFDIHPVGQFLAYTTVFQFLQFTVTGTFMGLVQK